MTDRPLVPHDPDTTVHLVLNDYGDAGCTYVETDLKHSDLENVIGDLIAGQHHRPVRVTAFNVAEGWSRDVSEDIAREVWARTMGRSLPHSTARFIQRHILFPIAV